MAQGDTKKYIKPWRFDSQGITNRELSRTYIYRDDIIDDFLDPDPDNRLFFLVGPKGCGKTLLIHYKAYLYFNSYEDDRNNLQEVNASRDLVESLDFSEETLTQVGIKELQSVTVWNKVWEFAIMLVVLRKSKVGLPEELKHIEKQFRNARSLSTIVVEVINNIEKYVFSDFFSCRNAMRDRLDDLQQSYVMFVDRLDQALDSLLLRACLKI
ncbi:hypothetical protein [Neolewinella agarilytica]|uniref:Uncharacterized protein n=1 Tax=Neolewinella agarilytica TaxID=478744 RepID=A0A1H9MJB6_9BACT|nr:hypothetical protein [Neolewinella agarilytica]SER23794.1 hypothetical protein SAMN05444359_12949 [Neolewinella agarilytica]